MSHPINALLDRLLSGDESIAVIGLGYVGLPLACCLARRFSVLGVDTNGRRIAALAAGHDPQKEVEDAELSGLLSSGRLRLSQDPAVLASARFHIVCVPTPINQARQPDLTAILGASRTLGPFLRPGSVVVYESTVYPGCTEEDCLPVLEEYSGLSVGQDFTIGYSPERINPGDREHRIERVVKVVSGSDDETLRCVAGVYGAVIHAGVHCAPSIRVAEAAKVIENTQRDLNIALVNELALIFHRLGIDTQEVLAAARTKWNFLPFSPGLVGGHCIGVDPYYLTHRAERAGYHPQVILAGRHINDSMGLWIAHETMRLLCAGGTTAAGSRVLILGVTFKENCPDVRNSRVLDIIAELQRWGSVPVVCDPLADAQELHDEHGLTLTSMTPLPPAAAVIVAVAHQSIRQVPLAELAAVLPPGAPVMDVKGIIDREGAAELGLTLWRL